jgi:bacterioferritin-associated ferredoxin
MYICLCQGVTDGQIRDAVEQGLDSMARVRQETGLCNQCGRCGEAARQVFEEACSEQALSCHIGEEGTGWMASADFGEGARDDSAA